MHLTVWMLLLVIVNCLGTVGQNKRRKRVSVGWLDYCSSCVRCSGDNGCSTCQKKLFLLIWREGIRQYGACVHSCPPGYFGVRGQEVNRCTKCKTSYCETCFSKDFCMRCKEGFYLFKGKCLISCPEGTAPDQQQRECFEEWGVSLWSEWSRCSRKRQTCGYKWGTESRTRQVMKAPVEEKLPCPVLTESRKCRMKKRCPGGKKLILQRDSATAKGPYVPNKPVLLKAFEKPVLLKALTSVINWYCYLFRNP
nr:PREDICTED: R-spondin-4 [Latimeria chalumnae]|eukprot:XP_014348294.1 PREDICTED: R-spondin-4 [Latimeria chalumnae]